MIESTAANNAIHPGGLECCSCNVSMAFIPIPAPAAKSTTPINIDTIVSIRLCPYGCELSGGFDQKYDPAITAISVVVSERLWIPSASTA